MPNKIIDCIKKLKVEGKGLYLENIKNVCFQDYEMDCKTVNDELEKCLEKNMVKKVTNR